MKRPFLTALIMTIVVFGLTAPATVQAQFFYMENEDIGKPVKDFTLKIAGGAETNLEQYRDGQKAIVFFWATWCPHCRVQLEQMNKDKAAIDAKGIKMVLVDIGESEEVVLDYLKSNNITMDVFLDVDNNVSDEYGLVGVPTFYYVGADGNVVDVEHSLPDDFDLVFNKTQ